MPLFCSESNDYGQTIFFRLHELEGNHGESIIIVGAGIAGLSAGCYAQMNQYKTAIFEMHNKPGGLCSALKRRVYL